MTQNRDVTLDPENWDEFRDHAHQALDDIVDYLRDMRRHPAWQPIPDSTRTVLTDRTLPQNGIGLKHTLAEFREHILPFPTGNIHPRFWSWIAGSGNPTGIIADMLAAGMNSVGLGFDDSAASYVELQVLDWLKQLFGFPQESSGLLVSGGSMANLVGIAVGRTAKLPNVRTDGIRQPTDSLVVYASTETHSSVQKAVELVGLGSRNYRLVPVKDNFEIDLEALRESIKSDKRAGLTPAMLIGNAGTINTGAIDDLDALGAIAEEYGLWYHVDGAFGAFAAIAESPPQHLRGLARVHSLAFDLHKWLHQPYNVGAVLVKESAVHFKTFRVSPPYLDNPGGGLAAGPINFNSLGVQLSRSFASLRIWMSFKTYGINAFRKLIKQNMQQAKFLESLILEHPALELLAPVPLNIVNFRYNPGYLQPEALDELNRLIVVRLQERGYAAPSTTRLKGCLTIRVGITNHRSTREDFSGLVAAVKEIGNELLGP